MRFHHTIPVLDCSVVCLLGPALKRDCICIWDRDGAGSIPAGSLLRPCSPWARLQLWRVPWEAKMAGVQERWDSLITEVHTVYLQVHNIPFTHHHFFSPDRFLVHICYSSCPGLLLKLHQLCHFFCRHQWCGAGGGHLAACCCLFDVLSRLLVESRDL